MIEKKIPVIYLEVANWWYHYYSRGENAKIRSLCSKDFALSEKKCTPDFENLVYDYGICHPQIGANLTAKKSIVLMKTTVGCSNSERGVLSKSPYVVGYFRVAKIDKEQEIMYMDPLDSLLLLDNPIKLNLNLAKKLFPEKEKSFWGSSELFVRRVGSMLRNRKARPHEIRIILSELISRKERGASNFLGKGYKFIG